MSLIQQIADHTQRIVARQSSLEEALFALQAWIDAHAPTLSPTDRRAFSQLLTTEREAPDRDRSDDTSLIASVLRLHVMRLLFRYDASQDAPLQAEDQSPYAQGKHRLKLALREVENAVNEARIDAAIANAHHILGDRGANRRWLQDALVRVQTVAAKDLLKLADSIPMPEPPRLNLVQRLMFRVYGIHQDEIGRRTLASLRQLAELQTAQLAEMAQLLAESLKAIGDSLGAQQALAIFGQIAQFAAKR